MGGHSHSQNGEELRFREVRVTCDMSHSWREELRHPHSSLDLNSLSGCPVGEVGGTKMKNNPFFPEARGRGGGEWVSVCLDGY